MRIVRLAAAALIALAAAAAFHRLTVVPLDANARKMRLEHNTAQTLRFRARMQTSFFARKNLSEIEPLLARSPRDLDLLVMAATNYRLVARYDDAVALYTRALRLARRPEIHLGLGLTLLEAGRRTEAIEHLLLAARYHPSYLDEIYDPGAREEVRERLGQRL